MYELCIFPLSANQRAGNFGGSCCAMLSQARALDAKIFRLTVERRYLRAHKSVGQVGILIEGLQRDES